MFEEKPISYMPTVGPCYDPGKGTYWDKQGLSVELRRVFEVCHGCRLCLKFCDSFPNLFKFIDEGHSGDVGKLSNEETKLVMDDCFQCKLCEVHCPYTPRDKHYFQNYFPKLVHRYRAINYKEVGATRRDKLLSDTNKTGKMARMSLGLANGLNRMKVFRLFLQKYFGIHKDKLIPKFASQTFEQWAWKSGKIKTGVDAEVVLFQTCYVQNNDPSIGRDTIEVMERNEVNVVCVKGFKCCGMPSWEHGDLEKLRSDARHNIKLLLPFVEKGAKVLVINPTCGMMMRKEYITLLSDEDREDAQKIAEAIRDPAEYLWSIREQERFNTDFKSRPGNEVGYHVPCHLKAQYIGFKGRDMLRKIPGVKTKMVMSCCGHDGSYAMKEEKYEASIRIGEKAFSGMKETETEVWSTECPLAAIQFKQHAGVMPLHPMTILARSYHVDGFPHKIENE